MNGLDRNNTKWQEQQEILSNAHWQNIFQLLEFMVNGIYPDDFDELSPSGDVRDYFKAKYQVTFKN